MGKRDSSESQEPRKNLQRLRENSASTAYLQCDQSSESEVDLLFHGTPAPKQCLTEQNEPAHEDKFVKEIKFRHKNNERQVILSGNRKQESWNSSNKVL
jgi:hypothetical protein